MADTLRVRCLGLALTALAFVAGDASAQSVVVGNSSPNVVVDLGVLDSLGPAPTLPSLLKGRQPHRVALRPPGAPAVRAPQPAARSAPAREEPPKASAPAPQPLASAPAPAAAAPPPAPAAAAPPPPPPAPAPAPAAAAPPPPPAAAPPPPPRVAAAPPAPPPAASPPTASRTASASPPAAPPAAAPPPPPTQTAARPPAALPPAAPGGSGPRLVFGASSSELPAGADATLRDVAQRLNADESLRLQVVAYADGTPEQASQARRLSLSRALTVRSYLISQGVRSTRIDVRALGSRASDGPPDRVDLLIGDR